MAAFWLAGLLVFASVVFLLAYLFGMPLLYGGTFTPPALTSSIALAALGAALLALAGPRAWAPDRQIEAETLRASLAFVLVFALMTIGLVTAKHSQASRDVLKNVEFPWPVAEIALQHHERMDGSGYPRGLKGEDIVLEARILAVADTVEAMSSHRPYRAGLE